MKSVRTLLFVSLLGAGVLPCNASETSPPMYTAAPGFSAVDADMVESAEYYSAERFPGQGASVFHPDADLAPPVRALLLVEHQDGQLPHARYRVSWQVAADPQVPEQRLDYVEVQRVNLGPVRREDVRRGGPGESRG